MKTDQKKARLLDLTTGILEMTRDGNRDIDQVLDVFQVIKDERNFATILERNGKPHVLKPMPSLLELVGTVSVLATTKRFIAREKFVVDTSRNAKVKISYLGSNFKSWFLEKIEGPSIQTTLRYAKLLRRELDGPIMAEIGDAKETLLAQIHSLMERQATGKECVLLTNGWSNIFYVRDANNELRAVLVRWRDDGWLVHAFSVTYPLRWNDGYRVFSSNSSVAVAV